MVHPFFTIGHSTRSIPEFTNLLEAAKVALLVDVRTVPRSRTNPQYNSDTLAESLARFEIHYERIAELGGLRSKRQGVPTSVNAFWINQSFHNYADYATTEPFRAGLAKLRAKGRQRICAIMCAEAVWWRCHRRIIADYLLSQGEAVFHILGHGQIEPARRTPTAVEMSEDTLAYP